ncbi:TTC5 protein, partial [Horornis vulcanius]|nr:TTC5 protein [Horornis vulcanius]
VLGNAHVSLFFAGGQSPGSARRALAAYAQAVRGRGVGPGAGPGGVAQGGGQWERSPQLLQYLERFQGALEGLSRAAELAPGWEEPRKRHGNLLEFLNRLC